MRYGAPVFDTHTPEEWIASHRRLGYGAAYFPLSAKDDPSKIDEYAQAAREAGLVIAEVGAWSNPIDPNPERREQAVRYNIEQLELAERVGARCCVNISGSCHPEIWMAAHPDNLSEAAFEKIVQTVRRIIDAVNPTRTFYTLECMPWSFPDSVDSYLELIKRVDRKGFAVHLDPCNLVNCPRGLLWIFETHPGLREPAGALPALGACEGFEPQGGRRQRGAFGGGIRHRRYRPDGADSGIEPAGGAHDAGTSAGRGRLQARGRLF